MPLEYHENIMGKDYVNYSIPKQAISKCNDIIL